MPVASLDQILIYGRAISSNEVQSLSNGKITCCGVAADVPTVCNGRGLCLTPDSVIIILIYLYIFFSVNATLRFSIREAIAVFPFVMEKQVRIQQCVPLMVLVFLPICVRAPRHSRAPIAKPQFVLVCLQATQTHAVVTERVPMPIPAPVPILLHGLV